MSKTSLTFEEKQEIIEKYEESESRSEFNEWVRAHFDMNPTYIKPKQLDVWSILIEIAERAGCTHKTRIKCPTILEHAHDAEVVALRELDSYYRKSLPIPESFKGESESETRDQHSSAILKTYEDLQGDQHFSDLFEDQLDEDDSAEGYQSMISLLDQDQDYHSLVEAYATHLGRKLTPYEFVGLVKATREPL